MNITHGILTGTNIAERSAFKNGSKGISAGVVYEAVLFANYSAAPQNGEPLQFVDFGLPNRIALDQVYVSSM
ncbi:hypothetical protein DCC85_13970 [Paenibacillus sp. CAA11]|nr:hypothetical protein DCC85_13970 [Paenibacillus sp. CAA11]